MKPNTPLHRVPRDDLPPSLQGAHDASMKLHGDATFVEVLGNTPHMLEWYRKDFYERLFYSGRLPRRMVELVRLRLANVHGCAFCNRADRISAAQAGITEAEMEALTDHANGPFSPAEKAALALADVMVLTNPKGAVTPELYAGLKPHLSDAQMVELGMIMAVLCGMAKFIFAYDLVEKEDYCPFAPASQAAE